jgi:hypothetical protein
MNYISTFTISNQFYIWKIKHFNSMFLNILFTNDTLSRMIESNYC